MPLLKSEVHRRAAYFAGPARQSDCFSDKSWQKGRVDAYGAVTFHRECKIRDGCEKRAVL